ncbi:MAG: hypothetical protein ACKV2T_26155 [Kofleriaceae bacterium]
MSRRASGLVIVMIAAACGEVSSKIDAPPADMGGGGDADVDAPITPSRVTSISVQGITPFALPTATFTKVLYSNEVHDDESEFDPATSRFTPKEAGDYVVCAGLALGVPGFTYELDLYVSGVRSKAFAIGDDVTRGCIVVRLTLGEYVEVWTHQTSGNTVNVAQSFLWDWLTIARLPSTSVTAQTTAMFDSENGAWTKVPWANEQRDEFDGYDPSTFAFTAPADGDYFSCASINVNANFFGELGAYRNNTATVGFGRHVGGATGCRTTRLATGNALDVRFRQSNGGTRTIPHNPLWNWMSVYRVPVQLQVDTLSDFSVPSGVHTVVPYTSESFDTGGQFDVVTSKFGAAQAGDYLVCASMSLNVAITTSELDIFKNGQPLVGLAHGRVHHNGCHVVRLAMGDQIDIRAYHTFSAAVTVTANPLWDWLQISKL